ncbi:MAG: DNA polymerase III subunit alpha [Acutalibacteraceae bacterium]
MAFVHLHVHSEYSLLDGACKLKELVKLAKSQGQTAVAVTDHGAMYSAVDFYKLAKKEGIKPVIGCEVYVAKRGRLDKTPELDRENRHMVLLCKNNTGYQNLIKLVSLAWTEGFYNKPRIDDELLEKYHEGLICLSACLAGELPKLLLNGEYEAAKNKALYYQRLFGKDNYYIELQDHGIQEQKITNPQLIKISRETGIPLVVTNDCHYLKKEDSKMHHILLCIQTNHTVLDEDKMEFATDEFYFKSEQEMRSLFPDEQQAFDNTAKIAEMCNVEFEFGNTKLPHFEVPDKMDHFEYFKKQCYDGLYKKYGKNPGKALTDRLEYELETVKKMGYVDYYLIVNDFIQYAKSQNIPVGPGRGSGAGSLAAYCIGITGIDPIKYNLLFERFLNPERVSMPDFDIDFCKDRRQEVIDYVIRKYGVDHVAQIIAFGTMAARGAIRDVGRALAIPYAAVDVIAKLIPNDLGMTIEKALSISAELKNKYDTEPQTHDLIDMAMSIEGMPRHATTHAAGVVITRDPVDFYVPLAKNDEAIVTQYTMTTLEELGLLKMDFLGLRNLTVLKDAEDMILLSDPNYSESDIKEDDRQVFDMLSQGQSEGVFQFESQGMKNVLTQLKPNSVEDLIAVISLYRPGPMDSIPMYIENRHNPQKIKYKHPLLKEILDVTYGCIVYQEQVMQIFRTLAGYSLGRADIVRRAMSKKKKDVMEYERNIFINGLVSEDGAVEVEGCIRRGVDESTAVSIFKDMESFASYAFNKSHAAAYANISYKTAWMKCHYPKEYMAALLTSVLDNTNKLSAYTAECKRLGIEVLPPDVNVSTNGFTVSGGDIRFGLMAIKNLGKAFIDEIVKERKNGQFTSFYNFCKRMHGKGMNSRAVESLIKCGALDGLNANRRQMLANLKTILDGLDQEKRKNMDGQLSFFDSEETASSGEPVLAPLEEFPMTELLAMEKEIAGMYLSGHPMKKYEAVCSSLKTDKILDIVGDENGSSKYRDGAKVRVIAIISSVKLKATKNNAMMAFVTLEDISGSMEMLVFPQTLTEYGSLFLEGNVIDIMATVSLREEEEAKLLCNQAKIAPTQVRAGEEKNGERKENTKKTGQKILYLRMKSRNSTEYKKAENLISIFDGASPVIFVLTGEKKQLKAPRSLYVDINDVLIKELKRQIGEENVAIKEV